MVSGDSGLLKRASRVDFPMLSRWEAAPVVEMGVERNSQARLRKNAWPAAVSAIAAHANSAKATTAQPTSVAG